jgi:hypothetical protein
MLRRIILVAIDWLPFISVDTKASTLKNGVASLVLDYNSAVVKINKAKAKFEKTRGFTVSDFQRRKQYTLDKTMKSVDGLKRSITDEANDVEVKIAQARDKVHKKRVVVDELINTMQKIGGTDFPLE